MGPMTELDYYYLKTKLIWLSMWWYWGDLGCAMGLQSRVGSKLRNLKILIFWLQPQILQQIKDSIPIFLTQYLEQPVSVHMQKKWGELGQKWPS